MARGRKSKNASGSDAEDVVQYARRVESVHVDSLHESPLNPRKIRGAGYDEKVRELAASIARVGVLEAPIVREIEGGGFEVLAGERRWRASIIAAERVPERAWIEVVVIDAPDDVAFEIACTENDQRESMHPLDQCASFVMMRDEHGRSVAQIAAKLGRTPAYVYDRLRLEQLGEVGRTALLEERMSLTVALILARIGNAEAQDRAVKDLMDGWPDGAIPVSAALRVAKTRLMVLADAPFDTADADLVSEARSCGTCPKRSGAQQELFGDLLGDDEDRCTDSHCWDLKARAAWARVAKVAEAAGKTVVGAAEAAKIFPNHYGGPAGGYVVLDQTSWETDGKTWRDVLGDRIEFVEITVAPRDGKAVELAQRDSIIGVLRMYPRDDDPKALARRASEESSVAARAEGRSVSERDFALQREVRVAAERRVRDEVAAVISAPGWAPGAFWRDLAECFIALADSWGSDLDGVARRFGVEPPSDDDRENEHGGDDDSSGEDDHLRTLLRRALDGMKDARRLALIVDLVLDELHQRSLHADVEALLAGLGVDRKKIEKDAEKAAKKARQELERAVGGRATKRKTRGELDAEEFEAKRERMEDAHGA